jgi:biopolymer transport protein ExbD
MASIDTGGGDGGHKKSRGVKKAKKLSTRIDMTPMVDLGFLLITFFIFTTTMSSPTALKLNVPKDTDKEEEQNKAKESGALTIMLGKGNNIYYYEGQLKVDATGNNFVATNEKGFRLTIKDVRDVILKKKADVISRYRRDQACIDKKMGEWKQKGIKDKYLKDAEESCEQEDLVVVIKPSEEATYKNTVDVLDEMSICRVLKYAMVKIAPQENELIKVVEGGQK